MEHDEIEYKGHIIFTVNTCPYPDGNDSWSSSYVIWRIDPDNNYSGIMQGSEKDRFFNTLEEARDSAQQLAKQYIDETLGDN